MNAIHLPAGNNINLATGRLEQQRQMAKIVRHAAGMDAWLLRGVYSHQRNMFKAEVISEIKRAVCAVAACDLVLVLAKAHLRGPAPCPPFRGIFQCRFLSALSDTPQTPDTVTLLQLFNVRQRHAVTNPTAATAARDALEVLP